MIKEDMIDAVKVQFIKPIFEDDFPERGMKAWLTGIEVREGSWKLYFDFTEFEAENDKYLREVYYPNIHTKHLPEKELYTAKEAGMYYNKYSVYFGDLDESKFGTFEKQISEYLKVIK